MFLLQMLVHVIAAEFDNFRQTMQALDIRISFAFYLGIIDAL